MMDNDETKSIDADSSFKSDVFIENETDPIKINKQSINELEVINTKIPQVFLYEEQSDGHDDDEDENLEFYDEETENEEDIDVEDENSLIDHKDISKLSNEEETTASLEHICLSPPQSSRTIKKEAASRNRKSKHNIKIKSQSKHKTKPKRPIFKNSAANLDISVDNDSLTDSLTNMQDEHFKAEQLEILSSNLNLNISSSGNLKTQITLSAPPTASINNSNYNYWTNMNNNSSEQNKSDIIENSSTVHNNMDPFDRFKSYEKISSLLKLALRNHQTKPNTMLESYISSTKVPPCTPATTSLTQSSNNKQSIFNQTIYSRQASEYSSNQQQFCFMPQFSHKDEQSRQMAAVNADKVFKSLYDFFVHFDDRADSEEIADFRLKEARKIIPFTIEDVINTNFGAITCHMDNEINKSMKSPSDYSLLYEHKPYIDQLCYLYWLVEDILNRITYIETLYPSTKAMSKDQPDYANEKFESTYKTLLLWYKIMTGLLNSCDVLGRYLGFAKKQENFQYWTWFDQRLNYSKSEYERVQKWINDSLQEIMIPSLINTNNNNSESSILNLNNPVIDEFNSNSTLIENAQNNKQISFNYPIKQITKDHRQISFELKSSNPLSKIYLESPSIRFENGDNSALYMNDSSCSSSNKLFNSNTNLNSDASSSISNPSSKIHNLNSNLLGSEYTSILINSLKESNLLENNHLTPAKLHHLDSFITRTTSFRSSLNEAPSNLSSNFYNTLLDNQLCSLQNNNNENASAKVEFNLDDDYINENTILVPPMINHSKYRGISFDIGMESNEQEDPQKLQNNYLHKIDPIVYTNRQKIFGEFLKKRLTKYGLTKTCDEIRKVVLEKLPHALQALQIDRCERNVIGVDDHFYYHLMPLHHKCKEFIDNFKIDDETIKYGCKSDSFKRLELPSFRPLYMYISNIILELMHMCLRIQIENNVKNKRCKYSLLSIEVLCNECRECIEQAILVRQFYFHMVVSVFERNEMDVQAALESSLLKFDEDLKEIINIYLNFITDWVHDLVANQDLSKALWVLKDEWQFCKNNLYFVTASEDMYAKRFCTLCGQVTASLLDTISFIDLKHKQPLMEYVTKIEMDQELGSFDEDTTSNSIPHERNESEEESHYKSLEGGKDGEAEEVQEENNEEYYEDEEYKDDATAHDKRKRYGEKGKGGHFDANIKCNEFKDEINQLRKSCMKALDFCANLFSDLELAAKYEVKSSIQRLLDELKASNHVLVEFTNPELQSTSFKNTLNSEEFQSETVPLSPKISTEKIKELNPIKSPSFLIFAPFEFSKDKVQIVRLLFIISEKDDFENHAASFGVTTLTAKNKNENTNSNRMRNKSETEQKIEEMGYSGVRRLSSSNSFLDMNVMMNKLSKIAQINPNLNKNKSKNDSNNSDQGGAFIITPNNKADGYLLYIKLPKTTEEKFEWTGHTISLYASMPVRKSLYQHKNINDKSSMINLILVTPRQQVLVEKRIEIKKKLKGTISLVKEKTSFHPNIEYAIDELKDNILKLRDESVQFIRLIEKDLKNSIHYHNDSNTHMHVVIDQRYLSEIWRVSYNFGIELQNECIKLMTQDRAETFSLGLAEFAILWSNYIVDKTERGKGRTVRPWAAKKGIQLMQEACNHSSNLKDEDFARLIAAVEKCILHVIGDRGTSSKMSPSITSNSSYHDIKISRSFTVTNKMNKDSLIDHYRKSEPELSDSEKRKSISLSRHSLGSLHSKKLNVSKPPSQRFSEQCQLTDIEREKNLLQKRYIGKILDQEKTQKVIPVTEVNFRWQLGLLIGEGQYGKVYSCVNLETGESMAMKEIPFKSNDINAIKELADEINNVQGIVHENLVKFYGAELHRKEILIFMEFCGDNCTLDRISRESSGLPEKIVRDHTKSLLKAVEKLHENNIMHRDIKGANIFLKVIDPKHPERTVLKLGDFGCSIKFKDPIGPIAGPARATGFMGTFPFMAPEVMVSGGATDKSYTFTADIWSVGCVVIEMFTGKRPWHPLSDQNIVFKVHILQEPKPPYPTNHISDEAINFLDCCLEFDQEKRPSAEQLLDHAFVKVPINDDKYESLF